MSDHPISPKFCCLGNGKVLIFENFSCSQKKNNWSKTVVMNDLVERNSPYDMLTSMYEVAEICQFCRIFQQVLHLPKFSRTVSSTHYTLLLTVLTPQDLQFSLVHPQETTGTSNELLAEIHFKLCRDSTGIKMEKIVQDWEKSLNRKLQENWRLHFDFNPMKNTTYNELTVRERVLILRALCHWKLESSTEIRDYLDNLRKSNPDELSMLQSEPIGNDDEGKDYWYFDDECWVYTEFRSMAFKETRKTMYKVKSSDSSRICLSVTYLSEEEYVKAVDFKSISFSDEYVSSMDEANTHKVIAVKKSRKKSVRSSRKKEPVTSSAIIDDKMEKELHVVGSKRRFIIDDDSSSDSDQPETKTRTKKGRERSATGKNKVRGTKRVRTEDHLESFSMKIENVGGKSKYDSRSDMKEEVQLDDKTNVSKIKSMDGLRSPNNSLKQVKSEEIKEVPNEDLENFDICCENCRKTFDMRKVDPPLIKRPQGNWSCFECLVNSARGWPRRRSLGSRKKKFLNSIIEEEKKTNNHDRRHNSKNTTSRRQRSRDSRSSRKNYIDNEEDLGERGKTKRSSSSSRKRGEITAPKKQKPAPLSSKGRRRESKQFPTISKDSYEKCQRDLDMYLLKKKKMHIVYEKRKIDFEQEGPPLGPTQWNVACSTLEGLQELVVKLNDGSFKQKKLQEKLQGILEREKRRFQAQEKKRQQQFMWQILPRRQSSRIAQDKIKHQVSQNTSHCENNEDDSDEYNVPPASEPSLNISNDEVLKMNRRKLINDRASRARRRNGELDLEELSGNIPNTRSRRSQNGTTRKNSFSELDWVDWKSVESDKQPLHVVSLAIVDRLLKDESSILFSRPVNPSMDGCPTYFDVIKRPMDLGTVRIRIESGLYQTWENFKQDIKQIWDNCRAFNASPSAIVDYANHLEGLFISMTKEAENNGIRKILAHSNPNGDSDSNSSVSENVNMTKDSDDDPWKSNSDQSKEDSSDESNYEGSQKAASPRGLSFTKKLRGNRKNLRKKVRPNKNRKEKWQSSDGESTGRSSNNNSSSDSSSESKSSGNSSSSSDESIHLPRSTRRKENANGITAANHKNKSVVKKNKIINSSESEEEAIVQSKKSVIVDGDSNSDSDRNSINYNEIEKAEVAPSDKNKGTSKQSLSPGSNKTHASNITPQKIVQEVQVGSTDLIQNEDSSSGNEDDKPSELSKSTVSKNTGLGTSLILRDYSASDSSSSSSADSISSDDDSSSDSSD